MPNGLFYLYSSNPSIFNIRDVWLVFFFFFFLLLPYFVEISVLNANSIDPDQTPRSAASDLGLHYQCLFWETPGINGLK